MGQPVNAADGLCYDPAHLGYIAETEGLEWCGSSRARRHSAHTHQREDGSLWEDHFSHACIGSAWFILTCRAPSLFWTVSSFNLNSSRGRTTREWIERRVTVWRATEHPDTESENTRRNQNQSAPRVGQRPAADHYTTTARNINSPLTLRESPFARPVI